jgi:DNA-binding beta-propeller fold protein YncE
MGDSHQVKVFDLNTNALLFEIGTYSKCGDPVDDLLSKPVSVIWTAAGNLLVACYYGQPATADKSKGHISEYDGTTGAYIGTVFEYTNTNSGDAWHGGVTHPAHMFADVLNNKLYVTYHMDNYVGVFDLTTYEYVETFGRTAGASNGMFRPSSCFPDETNRRLYVTLTDPDRLICLDLDTHDLLGSFGTMAWDDPNSNVPQLTSNLYKLSGVVAWGNTLFLANEGNNRIVSLPDDLLYGDQEVKVDYEGLDLTDLRVLAFSKQEVTVTTDGAVYYTTTKEAIYSEGFGDFNEVYIVCVEEDR